MIDVLSPTLWRADRLAGYVANVHNATGAEHVIIATEEAYSKFKIP